MTEESIRAEFEKFMSDDGKWPKAIERDGAGNYILMQSASSWRVWEEAYYRCVRSERVQAWRRDAERLRAVLKEAAAELECLSSELERIHRENPSIVATLPASNVLSMVRDAAMEQQI